MIESRSRDAVSGVRFVQKYCSAFRPTTGMPSAAITFEISRSIAAHPPSPETKTTSVSDVPRVAGTSTSGSFGVAADAAVAARSIVRSALFIWTGGKNSAGNLSFLRARSARRHAHSRVESDESEKREHPWCDVEAPVAVDHRGDDSADACGLEHHPADEQNLARADDRRREEHPRRGAVHRDRDRVAQLIRQYFSGGDRSRRYPDHGRVDQRAHEDGDVDDLQVPVVTVHG